tara:strand:+ start:165 stop:905 length:741 start_codon:yes stop_codon:yes gene_type:complete
MIIKTAVAALSCAAILSFAPLAPVQADDDRPYRVLSLSGTGEVKARPDTASISSGVVSNAKTAQQALAANSAAMNKLFRELKAAGIADRDLQTQNFSIAPQYEPYDPKNPVPQHERIIGYQVSNGVTVRVRDLDKLGRLIDQMTTAGANRMGGISFYVDKTDNLLEEARRKAMADVRRKADLYADGLGVKLKRVLTINESVSRPGPQPRRAMGVMSMAKSGAREAAPVAAGEQSLSIRLSVTWELD